MDDIERLVNNLSQDVQAVKPVPHPILLSLRWLAAAFGYLVIALVISGVRPDLGLQLNHPWFVAEIAMLAAILITTASSAALLSFPDLHQQRALAFAPAGIFALFVLVIVCAWQGDSPPALLPRHSFECTLSILGISLLPTAAIFYVMRRFASTHPGLSGTTAVLFAFGIGALWLRLYESNDSILHVIEWHYLPMIAVGLSGLWLGKRLLRW